MHFYTLLLPSFIDPKFNGKVEAVDEAYAVSGATKRKIRLFLEKVRRF